MASKGVDAQRWLSADYQHESALDWSYQPSTLEQKQARQQVLLKAELPGLPAAFPDPGALPPRPRPRTSWARLANFLAHSALAAAVIGAALNFLVENYEADVADSLPPVSAPSTLVYDLSPVRLQIRDSMEKARSYLKARHPVLLPALEKWNDPSGLSIHGELPRGLPIVVPEPRPGMEAAFSRLVFEGLGAVELHVFPFLSEEHLYEVASKCHLGNDGVRWMLQWSTWREGVEKVAQTKCRPGGVCFVLSRKCDADAFSKVERPTSR